MKESLNRTRADPVALTSVVMTIGGYGVYLAGRPLLAGLFALEAPQVADPEW